MNTSSENRTHRTISILLVLILHILLIFALLRFMVSPHDSALVSEQKLIELTINTARLPEPPAGKESPKPASTRAAVQPMLQTTPLPFTAPTPEPDIRGFGQALIGCAPENVTNLDEAQRSRCRKFGALASYDPSAVDYADRAGKVPGVTRWDRELARKKAPLLLPCGNVKAFDIVYTGGCIIANIANGFTFQKQYENQPSYSDKPEKLR